MEFLKNNKRLHEAPAAKKLKKKAGVDALELKAIFNTLPAEAQKAGYEGDAKSYTLADPQAKDGASKISVLVEKQTYYVCPVETLGEADQLVYKINAQEK